MKTVIVGGVAGGASAAARLRRLDEQAEIVMFERGEYISFANCGMPYYVGGTIQKKSALLLQTPESFYRRFRVDVRVLSEVTAVNKEEKTVTVKNVRTGEVYTERYDKLILATGTKLVCPPIAGIDNPRVFTLRDIPDTLKMRNFIEEKKPSRAVVIGGGFSGVEMAENLRAAGLAVAVVDIAAHLIVQIDQDMASELHRCMQRNGVELYLNQGVQSIRGEEGEPLCIETTKCTLTADMVVFTAGGRPDTELAQNAGLTCNSFGAIITDEQMLTSDSDIYAVGDAVEITNFVTGQKGYIPMAGPANRQGRIAADNICGLGSRYIGTQGSSVMKIFDMTLAFTGLSENAAKTAGMDCDKIFTYSPSHAGYYPGGKNMSVKTVYEKSTGRILGAQLFGFDGVDKRCDVFAVAIRGKMTAYDLAQLELCYAPPYSSAKDPVNMAGFVIENTLTGKVKNFHWHDVAGLPRDGSVTLLDVRTDEERAAGYIEGFIHIPLDELRGHIHELDKSKPIYVHCHSGLRSYIACRLLTGYGFNCYNLSGGYRLYESVVADHAVADHSCSACEQLS